jgi:N-acetylmuramoyl-L-alanine amidase
MLIKNVLRPTSLQHHFVPRYDKTFTEHFITLLNPLRRWLQLPVPQRMVILGKKPLLLLVPAFVLLAGGLLLAQDADSPKPGWFDKVKRAVGLGKEEQTPPPAPPPQSKPAETKPKPKPKSKTTQSKPTPTVTKSSKSPPKPAPKPLAKPESKLQPTPPKEETPPHAAVPATAKTSASSTPLPPMGPPDWRPMGPPPPSEWVVKAVPVPSVTTKPPVVTPEQAAAAVTAASTPTESKTGTMESAFTPPVKIPSKDMSLDSEFATLGQDDEPAPATKAAPSAPPVKEPDPIVQNLPAAPAAWQIYSYNGMDWVTAESIHSFYRFSEFKVSGEQLWFRNPTMYLKGRIGSQDMLINNIKFVLSYPITTIKGKACFSRIDLSKLLDPVIRPWLITQGQPFDTVIVDAGHGGHDSGAKGVYGYEKQYTLQLAHAVKAALIKRGFKVVLTRQDDRFISLGGRAQFANSIPNSIFISLHFNSSGSAASGIETFALTPQGSASTAMGTRDWDSRSFTGNVRDAENIALATAVHAMVIHRYKLIDRGIKRARWSVLTGCNRPGILFEGGFVTNSKDGALIASPAYQTGLANAIGDALVRYQAALFSRTAQKSFR